MPALLARPIIDHPEPLGLRHARIRKGLPMTSLAGADRREFAGAGLRPAIGVTAGTHACIVDGQSFRAAAFAAADHAEAVGLSHAGIRKRLLAASLAGADGIVFARADLRPVVTEIRTAFAAADDTVSLGPRLAGIGEGPAVVAAPGAGCGDRRFRRGCAARSLRPSRAAFGNAVGSAFACSQGGGRDAD